ncbi:MAG TPA: hypothetical protein PK082_06715, partial [Phycisphaerae bacterium]|nr:hypothetical protein [Phycisphaerae bacterium]
MRLTVKLLAAHWRRHWFRTLLAFGAMITAVAMVIVVVGGQDVAIAQADLAARKASGALGRFDLIVVAGSPAAVEANRRQFGARPPLPGMSKEMLSWLRSRGEVQGLLECAEMGVEACQSGQIFRLAAYSPGQLLNSPLMATACPDPPYPMLLGEWVTGAADDEV